MDGWLCICQVRKKTVTTETIICPGVGFDVAVLDLLACPTYDVHELKRENFKCL